MTRTFCWKGWRSCVSGIVQIKIVLPNIHQTFSFCMTLKSVSVLQARFSLFFYGIATLLCVASPLFSFSWFSSFRFKIHGRITSLPKQTFREPSKSWIFSFQYIMNFSGTHSFPSPYARKNSRHCREFMTFLFHSNYSEPHSQNRIFDASILLMWLPRHIKLLFCLNASIHRKQFCMALNSYKIY